MKLLKIKAGGRVFRIKDCRGLSSMRGLMFDKMENIDGALIRGDTPMKIWMPFVNRKLRLLFLDKGWKVVKDEIAVPMTASPKTWKTYDCENAVNCLELKDIKFSVKKGMKVKLQGSVV